MECGHQAEGELATSSDDGNDHVSAERLQQVDLNSSSDEDSDKPPANGDEPTSSVSVGGGDNKPLADNASENDREETEIEEIRKKYSTDGPPGGNNPRVDDWDIAAEEVCGRCEVAPAEVECLACCEVFCTTCSSLLHNGGRMRAHELQTLGPARRRSVRLCRTHSGEKMTLFCHDCRVPACAHCLLVGPHEHHRCTELEEAFSHATQSAQRTQERLKLRKLELDRFAENLEAVRTRVVERKSALAENVSKLASMLKEEVSRLETQAIESVENEERIKNSALENQINTLKDSSGRIGKGLELLEELLQPGVDKYKFLTEESKTSASLEPLLSEDEILRPAATPAFAYRSDTRVLMEMVASFGEGLVMTDSGCADGKRDDKKPLNPLEGFFTWRAYVNDTEMVPAEFGPRVPDGGLQGELVVASPADGSTQCTNPRALQGKIAVMIRGTVPFVPKARNAQRAGATALVIVNNELQGPRFDRLGYDGELDDIGIPTVLIPKLHGDAIMSRLPGVHAVLRKSMKTFDTKR